MDIEDLKVDMPRTMDDSMKGQTVSVHNSETKGSNHHDGDVDEAKTALVPGTQKIFVKTYGCSHNISDSEYMEGMLSSYGYRIADKPEDADLWLLNSCTVKDPSQSTFMNLVNKGKESNKPVVVAGCVPQGDKNIPGLKDVSVVGITQIDRVVEAVEKTLNGENVKMLEKKTLPRLDLPKVRKNKLVEIIPLSTGCLGSCTYCKTKHARGVLGSYSLDAIVERAQVAISEGVSEIWLSSEDTGAYGRDIGTNIAILLRALVNILPDEKPDGTGSVMLRVGMTNPPYILEHLEAIAEILNHPKVFAFLHIPVQAGSNRVLDGMNREYVVEEYIRIVDYLTEHVPQVTLATDIICGFPNERESDFEKTMKLIERHKLAITNISQFYPRPGTPAARMKRIETHIVKNRSRRLTKLFESFTPYTSYVGTEEKVWFGTETSDNGNQTVGHTKAYVKVVVDRDDSLIGQTRMCKIEKCARFHIHGKVIGFAPPSTAPMNTTAHASSSVDHTIEKKKDEDSTMLYYTSIGCFALIGGVVLGATLMLYRARKR